MDEYGLEKMLHAVKTKGLKYAAVSVVNVVVGQGLLVIFTAVMGIAGWIANVLAVAISAGPAYVMSRAWVWGKTGKNHFKSEVLPFWGFALVGLLFSTLAVRVTQDVSLPLIANIANLGAFGILWVIKFFILDAVLFKPHPVEEPAAGTAAG